MADETEQQNKYDSLPYCDCKNGSSGEPCTNCEIGYHDRCSSSDCHVGKWSDLKGKYARYRR
jgi:hypothetical protein